MPVITKEIQDKLEQSIINKLVSPESPLPGFITDILSKELDLKKIINQVRRAIPAPQNGTDGKDAIVSDEMLSDIVIKVLGQTQELIQVKDGADGRQGPQGTNGEKGDRGDRGMQGEIGQPGEDGRDGRPGVSGPMGIQGDKGKRGVQGIPGESGNTGEEGAQGEPGKDGEDFIVSENDFQSIIDRIDFTEFVPKGELEKVLKKLKLDLEKGLIRIPQIYGGGGGLTPTEIVNAINKVLGNEDWQKPDIIISNDGTEIGRRDQENYTTDDNINVTSTDNPTEDRVDTAITISDNPNFDSILYNKDVATPTPEVEGLVRWNDVDLTIDVVTGLGPVLQVGQEMFVIIYNGTGGELANATPVYPVGAIGGRPSMAKANASTHVKILGEVLITTMIIPDGEIGFATMSGKIRGVDTTAWNFGDTLWVGTTDGTLTNIKPSFPNYAVQVGGVTVEAEGGEIQVSVKGTPEDTVVNFWNGTFRETIDFMVSAAVGVITGTLQPDNGHPDMTMMFSDGFTMLATDPPATIVLTEGTDDNPQDNFVYIPKSTKVLTVSTSDWPATEHIKVANVTLRTATTTENDGALVNRNWNDHIENTTTFQGHLPHITEKLRQFEAQWDSGAQGSASGFPSNFYVSTTAGVVYQLHKQSFPAQSMPTDDIHVANNFATPYVTTNNLNTQTLDALGNTLANSSFSFVVWGVQNRIGETSHLMCNLPVGNYAKNAPANAVSDALNYSVYSIPKSFQGTGFLIARFTMVLEADGTTWSLYDTEDLRGKLPNTTAGGGAGGTGVTTWTGLSDTPNAYTGFAGRSPVVNPGETALEFAYPTVTVVNSATYDLLVSDQIVHVTYTPTGPVISLTIPSAQFANGREFTIKDAGGNAGTNNITIDTEGAETIDGAATYVMNTNYESKTFYSDGTNLFIK